jgi:hypothetical protein
MAPRNTLSPRKITQKELAVAIMEPGVTYTDVGERLIPDAKYPRQAVYNRIQKKGVQRELQKQAEQIGITREQFLKRIKTLANRADDLTSGDKCSPGGLNAAASVYTLVGKAGQYLVEKVESKVTQVDTKDLAHVPGDELQAELVRRLRGKG